MKGLLLKDYYQMIRYCRSMLLVLVMFLGVSLVNNSNLFFSVYPCLLCSVIPVTLISYDERSHWNQYSGTMPYTAAQIVGSKYLLGLLVNAAAVCVSLLVFVLRGVIAKQLPTAGELLTMGEMMVMVSLMAPALCLPLIIRLGVEKGRMAFYGVVVLFFGGGAALSTGVLGEHSFTSLGSLHFALLAMMALYALSWAVSLAFYRKKEL